MKNFLNQSYLFIILLFTLLALAMPASADTDYHFVAGTEFNPRNSTDSYFFLKDFIKHSTNDQLQFMGDRSKQDIVVCENKAGKVTLFNWNYGFNVSEAFHRVEEDLFINDEEYIVTTPRTIAAVKGRYGNCGGNDSRVKNYSVVKSLDYADRYMFIARPNPCHNTAVLHYILDGMHEDEDYEVALGFTNISDITNADLSVNLDCYVHYFKEGDSYNPIGNTRFEWNINARENILEKKFGRFKTSKKTKRIVVTIVIKSSPIYAVLGVDYIKINSKRELTPKTQTPVLTGGYNECVTETAENLNFSDYFKVVEGTPLGTLRFYEDANLTKSVTTFASAPVGTKTYYYTYQEDGKEESESGTLTVTVKGNETLTVKSNPSDATITCNNPEVTLTVEGTPETTLLKWTGPKSEDTNVFTTSLKGEYNVEGIASNGCPAFGSITVKEYTTKPIITSIKSTDSKGNETNVVTCSEGTLTITPEVSTTNVTYQWDNNKTTSSITETEKGVYTLIVKDKTNGCTSEPKSITLDKDDTVPSVTITSFNSMDSDASETNVLTCSDKEIYLVANVEPNDVTYIWQGNEANNKSNFKVTAPGEYTLKVVSNTNGCTLDGIKYEVKQNVENPTVSLRTEFNEDGTAGSTVFTCDRVEIKLVADTESSPVEIDSYKWSNNATTESWQVMDAPGVYSVVVTAKNGCDAKSEITLTLDNSTPVATITQSADTITCDVISSTISATTDIESNYEWTFVDKTYTDVTEITVETKGTGSLKVISKETGCEALPVNFTVEQSIEKPSVPVIDNTKLALCPETGNYDLSSFIKDKKNNITYTFYDDSGEALSKATVDTKTPNTQYSYTVVATAKNGCESQSAEFDVVVDGFVDFDLKLSKTEPLVVGDDIVATVVPTGVEADTYTWQLNGDKVSEEGLEYTTRLYIDTKYVVTGTSRCDSKTKEASVEVVWPTAFTPHNKNGLNDTFADGMKLMIFNRFYTKIFEGDNGWDGTINGSLNDNNEIAVPGVYYYSVLLPNGQVKKGTIEIIKVD